MKQFFQKCNYAWGLSMLFAFSLVFVACGDDDDDSPSGSDTPKAETITVNGVSFTMVKVEGGSFLMGAADDDSDASSVERPQHEVTLSAFAIGQTEVTQELWQAVMGNNPSHFEGSALPVENVSWDDCQEFITRLNNLTGRKFRLPTEAEWEYAARGGKKSKGYKYAGSDNLGDVAWYWENSGDSRLSDDSDWDRIQSNNCRTHPVATKQANELGLYDMSGNVGEWCQDGHDDDYYSNSPTVNPCNTNEASDRVVRGGSWPSGAGDCRVADRCRSTPASRYDDLGLRLAL